MDEESAARIRDLEDEEDRARRTGRSRRLCLLAIGAFFAGWGAILLLPRAAPGGAKLVVLAFAVLAPTGLALGAVSAAPQSARTASALVLTAIGLATAGLLFLALQVAGSVW